ncbi:hypothetical protein [Nonomuraea sp. NPDC050786]|uniref:hypothetical protein n=1 Tax=Nonomuraea sp. NPDC050786 TaxID=3154840 RepID=UPI0033F3735A
MTMTYQEALDECDRIGAKNASDPALMASFCRGSIQILVGAASPRLVWEGAMKQGMTSRELAKLANKNPDAVHELMWL